MKTAEIRELGVDELKTKEREPGTTAVPSAHPEVDGQLEAPAKVRDVRRELARVKTILREKQ